MQVWRNDRIRKDINITKKTYSPIPTAIPLYILPPLRLSNHFANVTAIAIDICNISIAWSRIDFSAPLSRTDTDATKWLQKDWACLLQSQQSKSKSNDHPNHPTPTWPWVETQRCPQFNASSLASWIETNRLSDSLLISMFLIMLHTYPSSLSWATSRRFVTSTNGSAFYVSLGCIL
jgi:hypothetical protein